LPQHFNATLIIAGDGEEKENLKALAAGNDKIHFIGFQEKNRVPYWFNLADVFVFASRYDGWGLVINEAIAAGNAIICSTATGAATDKLIDGENAVLLNAEDVNGYAAAMEKMANDNAYREMLRSRSNQLRASLSSQYNAEQLHAIFGAVE
jgi:glycosyltransferase involved in cell wall biosynthesis